MPSSTSASPNGRANRLRLAKQDCPMGPLTGLKVIDLTHVMAGPPCTLVLAEMGGEVLQGGKKPPGGGSRPRRPPQLGDEPWRFPLIDRNQTRAVLDLVP